MQKSILIFLTLLLLLNACEHQNDQFNLVEPAWSGVTFSNDIDEEQINLLDYYYCYNGSGLAAADFNNDGLIDLFFGGNMVASALYLNQGSFKFELVTDLSTQIIDGWVHGATVCDINHDGLQDLYLCIGGPDSQGKAANKLLVNEGLSAEGVPSFSDQASMYGLADTSFSMHAAFLDFDGDDDLDLFIGTNEVNSIEKTLIVPPHINPTQGRTIDKLYENIGDKFGRGHDLFVVKDTSFGINQEGYCLGLAIDDINADGWPDIYVANDFMPNDFLYINQGGKGFKNAADDLLSTQSLNGMGAVIADINQDQMPDIFVLDMLPDNSDRKKSMISMMENQSFDQKILAGYNPEYIRNTTQLNLGGDPNNSQLVFLEIGQMLGIHATDWSWSPVFADFDRDGFQDLFISNGFVKDMTDLDFINYDSYEASFGKNEDFRKERKRQLLNALNEVKISNYLFKNEGGLIFKDVTEETGVYHPSFSNAVVAVDLDGDGDRDLVTNDINSPPLIYENFIKPVGKYLKLILEYQEFNWSGVGTRIYWQDGDHQGYQYINPTHGYLSSALGGIEITAPMDGSDIIEELQIIWPNGCTQILERVVTGGTVEVSYLPCMESTKENNSELPLFRMMDTIELPGHNNNRFNDFDFNPLWIRKYSTEGPAFKLGFLDALEGVDAILGGSQGLPVIAMWQVGGDVVIDTLWDLEPRFEDVDLAIFDYDLDGLNDVYIVSGGVEYDVADDLLQDRIYRNLGNGRFARADVLPEMLSVGSVVRPFDYDQDGDTDLFVGGRIDRNNYPQAPKSYLLENKGQTFEIVHTTASDKLGMITDAQWCDVDGDGWTDLVCLGEFMPLTILKNIAGQIQYTETPSLSAHIGLWESLAVSDLDNDGDLDFVAGNVGLNQDFKAAEEYPFMLYANDFDGNGQIDPIFAYYQKSFQDGERDLYPFHGMDDLVKRIYTLRKNLYRYDVFSKSTLTQIFGKEMLESSKSYRATQFESAVFLNQGGSFEYISLPRLVQSGPVAAIAIKYLDGDGNVDLLLGGNRDRYENTYGSRDNSTGWMLLGNGDGTFRTLLPPASGFTISEDLRAIEIINSPDSTDLVLCVGSGSPIRAFVPNQISAKAQ